MKIEQVIAFCNIFYRRFSALNLSPFQLKFYNNQDSCSISLIGQNDSAATEAVIVINLDTVRLLKIAHFEDVDTVFIFSNKLELYYHLLEQLTKCCEASGIFVSPHEAVAATLGRKINNWRELVIYVCSLLPEEQGSITVLESRYNGLWFLETIFLVCDGTFVADGFLKRQIEYKDLLELIRVVLQAVSGLFKIFDFEVDPFSGNSIRNMI
jgi:hypothetical protein